MLRRTRTDTTHKTKTFWLNAPYQNIIKSRRRCRAPVPNIYGILLCRYERNPTVKKLPIASILYTIVSAAEGPTRDMSYHGSAQSTQYGERSGPGPGSWYLSDEDNLGYLFSLLLKLLRLGVFWTRPWKGHRSWRSDSVANSYEALQ